ncbi:MAG: hypothetical protein F4X12_20495 [Acidobacteriia bacterium]|nr:hypothetical protein [Terriglobia bacterium]
MRLARGWWHFEFEAACLGDLSSCPRPGDRPPELLLRDVAHDPFGSPERVESGTEWCEDFEATRDAEWRLWMTNAHGVTWSLTIDEGECPQPGESLPTTVLSVSAIRGSIPPVVPCGGRHMR